MIDLSKFGGDIKIKGVDGREHTVDAEEVLCWSEGIKTENGKPDEVEFCMELADFIESTAKPKGLSLGKSRSVRIRHGMHCWVAIQHEVQEYQRFFAREYEDTLSLAVRQKLQVPDQSPEQPTPAPP